MTCYIFWLTVIYSYQIEREVISMTRAERNEFNYIRHSLRNMPGTVCFRNAI